MSGSENVPSKNPVGSIIKFQASDGTVIAWPPQGVTDPIELSDQVWSSSFGIFQREARRLTGISLVTLDFSHVEWADPIPTLSLCSTIREAMASAASQLKLVLGNVCDVTTRRGGFLKFLVQQGFIECLWVDGRTTFVDGEKVYTSKDKLFSAIEQARTSAIYSNSRCLTAKQLVLERDLPRENQVRVDTRAIEIVSKWLREIEEQCLRRFYERDPECASNTLVKLQIILLELLLNAAEHAYHRAPDLPQTFGVLVRLRRSDDTHQGKQVLANAIHQENKRCPYLSKFHRSSDDNWIEVFVVDNGCGLAADIDAWLQNGNPKLRPVLNKIKTTTNIISPLLKVLFSQPVSRMNRTAKSAVTGFQHISFVLADQFDFARLYSHGEWVGSTHPWDLDEHIGTISPRKRSGLENTPLGTAWHFCLRLVATGGADIDGVVSNWKRLRTELFSNADATPAKPDEWTFYDGRDHGSGPYRFNWDVDILRARPNSLLLPGSITKQHIHRWVKSVRQASLVGTDTPHFWLVGDLAPHEAKLFFEILSREQFDDPSAPDLDIILVTYTWHYVGLRATAKGFGSWQRTKQEKVELNGSRSIFELIRHYDSTLFWDGLFKIEKDDLGKDEIEYDSYGAPPSGGALLAEKIIWRRDSDQQPDLLLEGYLDVTEALADPQRATISRRALRRCWYALDERLPCIAADSLLVSMLPRERRADTTEWYASGRSTKADHVLINSVCATGQTIQETAKHRGDVIHLLYHPARDVNTQKPAFGPPRNGCIALNWHLGKIRLVAPDPSVLPYERIPGTPYVGRGGAKAIPVRRFHLEGSNTPSSYFQRSIYGANPQETYDQFDRLGVLKIGHWSYGSHHQLITINLGKAVECQSQERGPLLRWMLGQLESLTEQGASLVIYPSHRVTDGLVQALRRFAFETNRPLPRDFIPVHSLGRHAQTAIRIPSLTYDRIKAALRVSKHRKAIILDDAAVTGKVQREFGQLLRNAGAEEVYTLGLLTRTGIPLYRKYLVADYSQKHIFYWRWDVPSLGSRRYCPLCNAIELARSLKDSLFLNECSDELSSWINKWAHSPVETHWERSGLEPGVLPNPRRITFGKEWPGDASPPIPYDLVHRTTTGLAATVAELIRVTAYKDVGLKIAHRPADHELVDADERRQWLRSVAEILLVQTLLFFDDFELGELESRMGDLVGLLMELQHQPGDSLDIVPLELQQLICLTLMLAPTDVLPYVLERIVDQAGSIEESSVRTLVTVGALLRRTPKLTWDGLVQRTSRHYADPESRRRAIAFLSRCYATVTKKSRDPTSQACIVLFLVLGVSDRDSHSGLLRRLLLAGRNLSSAAVLHDLQLAASALELLPVALFKGGNTRQRVPEFAAVLKKAASHLKRLLEDGASEDRVARELKALHKTLYLGDDGWIGIRNALAPDVQAIFNLLRAYPSLSEWSEYLELKQHATPSIVELWRKNNEVLVPNIDVRCTKIERTKRIFCPPLAIQMIRDYLLNVVHVDRQLGDVVDMHCQLSDCPEGVELVIWNKCMQSRQVPEPKLSESLLSSLTDLIRVTIERDDRHKEMRVRIKLPFIHAIWNEATK